MMRDINCECRHIPTLPHPPDTLKLIHGLIQLVLIGEFVTLVSRKNFNVLTICPLWLSRVDQFGAYRGETLNLLHKREGARCLLPILLQAAGSVVAHNVQGDALDEKCLYFIMVCLPMKCNTPNGNARLPTYAEVQRDMQPKFGKRMTERPLLVEEDLPREAGHIADAIASAPLSSGYRALLQTLFRGKMRAAAIDLVIRL